MFTSIKGMFSVCSLLAVIILSKFSFTIIICIVFIFIDIWDFILNKVLLG